ncbi:MAG: class I SAM-dependent methyltransferase [Actinomycetota bacterium]|nr:class I SAM-dependent methyltransferase [Actinomycetota bacterium]
MAFADWHPPAPVGVLRRNGFARLSDLAAADYADAIRAMEAFQSAFLASTRPLWVPDFPIPADALAHFSRQWEYPYAWTNVSGAPGRVLDAGSGITFFPYLLSAAGFDVDCCDNDDSLGLHARFARASELTGCGVRFTGSSLTSDLPFDEEAFDAVVCISVLEHLGSAAAGAVARLTRVLRAGGRLVLTCDVDLRREGDLLVEDLALVIAEIRNTCELVHALDLTRPHDLLTSDAFLRSDAWRLPWPWRPPPGVAQPPAEFRSLAVVGLTARKRASA